MKTSFVEAICNKQGIIKEEAKEKRKQKKHSE